MFRHLSFRTKLLASYLGLVFLSEAVALGVLHSALASDLRQQLGRRLEHQARGALRWVESGGRHPQRLAPRMASMLDARITIVAPEGRVLGESSPSRRAQADARGILRTPEIAQAGRGHIGRATRYSKVDGEEMFFLALRTQEGAIVRLGVPTRDIESTLASLRLRLFAAAAIAFAAALFFGLLMARWVAHPLKRMTRAASRLAEGEYRIELPLDSPDEFGTLARALTSLGDQLQSKIGELTAERDRLSAILGSMVEGVLVFDGRGHILIANPSAIRVLRSPALVGKRLDEVERFPDLARFLPGRSESLSPVRDALIHDSEATSTLAVNIQSLHEEAGGTCVAVLHDITQLRRLQSFQKSFIADVSHELRTPVAAIQGFAETLLRGRTDAATAQEFIEIIFRHAQRIGRLVADLLRLSALEVRSRDEAPQSPVDVIAIIKRVHRTLGDQASAAKVRLETQAPEALVARLDPDAVEQILENLVSNALRYGREGGRVLLSAYAGEQGVHLEVRDDGPGIAAEHLPRIMERFYRVDPGRSRERGGTGLGLAIVKELIDHMDGSIRVESELGKGTCFFIELPAELQGKVPA